MLASVKTKGERLPRQVATKETGASKLLTAFRKTLHDVETGTLTLSLDQLDCDAAYGLRGVLHVGDMGSMEVLQRHLELIL